MRPILTTGALLAATMLVAPSGALAEQMFNRIATFPVLANLPSDRDPATATVAEIIAATEDGMMLVYTDSPQEALGMVDIADPRAPKPAGFISLDGEPTSVAISGGKAFVGVVTSKSYVEPVWPGRRDRPCFQGRWKRPATSPASPIPLRSVRGRQVLGRRPRERARRGPQRRRDPAAPLRRTAALLPIAAGTIDCAALKTVELAGLSEIAPEDAEPEFVDINGLGEAVVTFQENNHIAIVDVATASRERPLLRRRGRSGRHRHRRGRRSSLRHRRWPA